MIPISVYVPGDNICYQKISKKILGGYIRHSLDIKKMIAHISIIKSP